MSMDYEQQAVSFQRNIRRYYKNIEQEDTQSIYFNVWNAADNLFREELMVDEDNWAGIRSQSTDGDVLQSLGFPAEAEYEQFPQEGIEKFAVLPLTLLGPYAESRSRNIDELSADLVNSHDNERMVGSRDVELWYTAAIAGIRRVTEKSHTDRCLTLSYQNNLMSCRSSALCPLKTMRNHIAYDTTEFIEHLIEYTPDPELRVQIVIGKLAAGFAAGVLTEHEKNVAIQQCRNNAKEQFGLRL